MNFRNRTMDIREAGDRAQLCETLGLKRPHLTFDVAQRVGERHILARDSHELQRNECKKNTGDANGTDPTDQSNDSGVSFHGACATDAERSRCQLPMVRYFS